MEFTLGLLNRLLELVAEDQAIDDTIYHLSRALNNSDVAKIDLEKFLKVPCPFLSNL